MTEETQVAETTAASTSVSLPAFYGVKAGMTRIFDENGNHVPVTVIKLIKNVVTQVKTTEKDGYTAYQVGYNEKREKLLSKPLKGHLKKGNVSENVAYLSEIATESVDESALGKEVSLEGFGVNTFVDVTGTSKGKGFQGAIKRHNFAGGPASHGHRFNRGTGSVGQCASPGRVFKQKKMPGQMGNKTKTIQNLKIVEVNQEKGYLLIKGSIPGSKSGFLRIAKAKKL